MNKKMNSNSMEHVQKQHVSFNSRMGSSPSKVSLTILGSVVSRSCFELMLWINNDRWIIYFLIIFYSNTHKLILKNNSRKTLTGSWIRSPKLNQLSTWQKINFKCTFCVFSFTPMSKCRKRSWKVSQVSSETFPRNIRPSSFFSPFSVVRPAQIFGIFKKKKVKT